jgi:DNA-binding transcriptional LysR family regulator
VSACIGQSGSKATLGLAPRLIQCNIKARTISFMHMNLHHLAIFFGIAESGNLGAAAKRLSISQPALSRQLKWFEDRLGVVLFERLPRGMRLTQAGEILRDYASRLFEIERAASRAMQEIANVDRGQLMLGASNTIGTYLLPVWLAAFRTRYPKISVSVFVGNTEQVAQGVADLRFAFGFIEGPLHVPDLRVERLMQDEILPVAASGHAALNQKRLDPASLRTLPLLMREEGSGTRELVSAALGDFDIIPTNVMHLGNTEALKQAAVQGGGIAWLPRCSIESELASGDLVALKLPKLVIRRPLNLVLSAGTYMAPAGGAFLDIVRAAIKG